MILNLNLVNIGVIFKKYKLVKIIVYCSLLYALIVFIIFFMDKIYNMYLEYVCMYIYVYFFEEGNWG